jgi:hypothetical protein
MAVFWLPMPQVCLAIPARLSLSFLAGGGYVSDKNMGDDSGASAAVQISPSGKIDLSFSPRWKFAASAEFLYGKYLSADAPPSLAVTASSDIRYKHPTFETIFSIGAENSRYASIWLSEDSATNHITEQTVHFSPAIRFRLANIDLEAASTASFSDLTLEDQPYSKQEWAFQGGLTFPINLYSISQRWNLSLFYRWARNQQDQEALIYHQASIFLFGNFSQLQWKTQFFCQVNESIYSSSETQWRATASIAYPFAETLSIEGNYSFTIEDTEQSLPPSRHLAFIYLKWDLWEVYW